MIKLLIEYIFSTYYKYYIYDKQHIIYYQYKRVKFSLWKKPERWKAFGYEEVF